MVVFVSSPYRGDIEKNIAYAQECCAYEANELYNTPYAPHLFFPQFMEDDEMGIQHGLEMLALCNELHVYGKPSAGMKMEIEYAESVGIPVVYMTR